MNYPIDKKYFIRTLLKILAAIVLSVVLFRGCCYAAETMTDDNLMRAAIGEAIGEGIIGEEAVIRACINRGHLRGVYGLHNLQVAKATPKDWAQAREALRMARSRDITDGATGWGTIGDIQQFKRKNWFNSCKVTKHLGHHYFYKECKNYKCLKG